MFLSALFLRSLYEFKENAQVPVILNQITDTTVDENQQTELTARVSGEPVPQVEWSHNGVVLKNDVNFQVSNELISLRFFLRF